MKNIEYNNLILNYYEMFLLEMEGQQVQTISNKIKNIKDCNSLWDLDFYVNQKIKDFKKTNLCRDKFCNNCKKVNQSARMSKYMPELEKYQNISYLLTLTSPNVLGVELKQKIKDMSKNFRQLMRYISGNLKIKGIDFLSWGYLGAVRSLEVTFNNDSYHPHYHVLFIFKDLNLSEKDLINDYSYSYGELKNFFSLEEILLQKIWYLIINNKKVTKNNIDLLDLGYSCKLDKLGSNDYNEIFKYMTKGTQENGQAFLYENFKILYYSLYRVKQIQGYGCLYRINDSGDIESYEKEYDKLIEELREKENPQRLLESPGNLIKDKENILISRKRYFKYLKGLD